jgi:hypothetical protein
MNQEMYLEDRERASVYPLILVLWIGILRIIKNNRNHFLKSAPIL